MPYLKGYEIRYQDGGTILPKWDYGGDKSFTNRDWNNRVTILKKLGQDSYPLFITDLDKTDNKTVTLNNKTEFDDWLKNDFDQ